MPEVSRTEIQERVFVLVAKFGREDLVNVREGHALTRYVSTNNYAKLLFGGHIKGIFPAINQTAFTTSLFSSTLDSVGEVISYIDKIYAKRRTLYPVMAIASLQEIKEEVDKMRAGLSGLV